LIDRWATRRPGYIHFLLTSRRCQASSVPGRTIRCARNSVGSSRTSPASTARSIQDNRGLATCRRSTATSCRNTRISTFFAASPRASNANQPNIFNNPRYMIRTARPAIIPDRGVEQTSTSQPHIGFWHGTP